MTLGNIYTMLLAKLGIACAMAVTGVAYFTYIGSWTRYAPGFSLTAFHTLPAGASVSKAVTSLGCPFWAWIYDGDANLNQPISPLPGDDVVRLNKLIDAGRSEKLTLFYSTSKCRFVGYKSYYVVITNGIVSGTGVAEQD